MKILTCDDHAIFREGLRSALRELDAELVEAGSCDEALEVVAREGVDLVLLDLNLPGLDGWTGLRRLRSEHPDVPVVIVSASEAPDDVRAALEGGAAGFIPKSSPPEILRGALRLVLSGSLYIPPAVMPLIGGEAAGGKAGAAAKRDRLQERSGGLTERQLEVLNLLSRGLTNAEIADVLDIRQGTVKAHVRAIFDTLEVTNRTEATLVMKELGLKMPSS